MPADSRQDDHLQHVPACEACGGQEFVTAMHDLEDRICGGPGLFDVVRCVHCGLGRVWPVPADLSLYYPDSYPAFEQHANSPASLKDAVFRIAWQQAFSDIGAVREAALRIVARRGVAVELLEILESPKGALLDVGCGAGDFLADAKRLGVRVQGLELSPHGAEKARQRGIPCVQGVLEVDTFEAGRFDAVRMSNVLEHVASPSATLRAAHASLRQGGTLSIAVPNSESVLSGLFDADWYPLQVPTHLWQFNARSLSSLVEASGFEVLGVDRRSWGGLFYLSMRLRQERLGLSTSFDNKVSPAADRALQPMADLLDEMGCGDILHLVARKRDC